MATSELIAPQFRQQVSRAREQEIRLKTFADRSSGFMGDQAIPHRCLLFRRA